MICKHCLTKIDDDSVFCESCGSRVKEIGNNDETQLLPVIETKVVPSRSAAFAANSGKPPVHEASQEEQRRADTPEKEVPVKDISKLLAEIYDYEENEAQSDDTGIDAEPGPVEVIPEPEIIAQEPEEEYIIIGDVEVPAHPEQVSPVFCMACGRKLPDGAAFCDICGTATGAVEPAEIRRRKTKNSIAWPVLKKYFTEPAEALEKAASEEAYPLGAGVLVIKDILMALVAALCMNKLAQPLEGSWLMSVDPFGFAAKVFLLTVLGDIVLLALIFGFSMIFKAGGTVKELIAVCGTAYLVPGILWIITMVLLASAPEAGSCGILISMVITSIYTGKAIESVSRTDKSASMYMIIAVMVAYTVVIYGGLTWMIA